MHSEINLLNICGTVVIGDGEREETPILYVGEEVGTGQGEEVDIGLHPLEGKTLAAKARPNALSVVVMAPRGSMLQLPEIYMEKLAVGPGYPDGLLDLDMPPAERVRVLAAAKGCSPEDVRITVLECPRHAELIAELRSTGASVRLISDADVAGVMHCSRPEETGIDLYMGSGGAPQCVLGVAALKCMGGQMQGRLLFRNPHEADLARRAGIEDLDAKYNLDDLIRADVLFAATAVTNSSLLRGLGGSASSWRPRPCSCARTPARSGASPTAPRISEPGRVSEPDLCAPRPVRCTPGHSGSAAAPPPPPPPAPPCAPAARGQVWFGSGRATALSWSADPEMSVNCTIYSQTERCELWLG